MNATITLLLWDIQHINKSTLTHVLETTTVQCFCVKFQENRPSRLGRRSDTAMLSDGHTIVCLFIRGSTNKQLSNRHTNINPASIEPRIYFHL